MSLKIIFIKSGDSTFINKDEGFLRENHETTTIRIKKFQGLPLMVEQLKIAWRLLLRKNSYDAIFIWFADFYGFFPVIICRIFRKKSLVVLGGYDVYCLPEFNYGVCMNPVRKFCAKFIFRNASHIIALGKTMQEDVIRMVGYEKHYSQILNVPTGFDSGRWYCDGSKKKRIIMVAIADSHQRIKIKGIDRFMEIARVMPQYEFLLIGLKNADHFFPSLPPNVHTPGFVEDLRKSYSESMVYLQLSRTEGFPSVLCEAMLCECIPVATSVGGSREIVGNTGYIIEEYSQAQTVELIEKAITTFQSSKGHETRERILQNYTVDHRTVRINKILNDEEWV